jgi:hypothetical protein
LHGRYVSERHIRMKHVAWQSAALPSTFVKVCIHKSPATALDQRVNQGVAKGRPRHRHDVEIVTDRAVTVQPSWPVLCAQASKSIQLDEQMIGVQNITRQSTTGDPWANFHRRRFVNRRQAASNPTSSRSSALRQCVDSEAVCNRMSPECGATGTGQRANVLHAARDGALHRNQCVSATLLWLIQSL